MGQEKKGESGGGEDLNEMFFGVASSKKQCKM